MRKTNLYNIVVIGDQSRRSPSPLLTVSALSICLWVEYTRQDNQVDYRCNDDRLVRQARKHNKNLFSEENAKTLSSKNCDKSFINKNLFSEDYAKTISRKNCDKNPFSENFANNPFSENYANNPFSEELPQTRSWPWSRGRWGPGLQ